MSPPSTTDGPSGASRWAQVLGPQLPRPTVDPLLDAWLAKGGALSLVGPPGSGRTRLLQGAVSTLRARGDAVLELWPGRFAGACLVAARERLSLRTPLPEFPDRKRRGRVAAHQLLDRLQAQADGIVWVVADDVDQLRSDPVVLALLPALQARSGVHLLAAGPEALPDTTAVALDPLPVSVYSSLVDLFADSPPDWAADELHPGPALATLVAHPGPAAADGWHAKHRLDGLSPGAHKLLALVSLACVPVPLPADAHATELMARGLIVDTPGGLRLASPAVASELAGALSPTTSLHAELLALLPDGHPARVPHAVPPAQPAPDDLPAALRHLAGFDPVRAARWGQLLLRHNPDPDLARATAAAALDAGRRPEGVRVLVATASQLDDTTAADLLATAGLLWFLPPVDIPAARQCLTAVHALADGPVLPPAAVQVLDARLRIASGATAAALAKLQAASDAPDDVPGPLLTHRLLLEADGWAQLGRLQNARDTLDRLASLPEPAAREQAARTAARHLRAAGRVLDASAALVRAAAVDRSRPDPVQVRYLDDAARLAMEGGDPGAAIAHLTAAIQLGPASPAASPHIDRLRPRLAATLLDVGRYEDAIETARSCWADSQIAEGIRHQAATVAADVCMALEDSQAATTWLDRADATLPADAPPSKRIRIERRRCEVDLHDDAPGAIERIRKASRAAHRAHAGRDLSRLRALHAVALAQAHRHAEVGPTLERAIRPLRDAGAGRLLAEVRLRGGQAWLATGDLDEARKVLGSALVWAEETGHLHIRNRANDLLDSARPTPGTADARLDRLVDITTALARERDPARVRQKAIAACAELLHADRVFVLGITDGNAEVRAAWHADGQSPGTPSSSVIRAILGHGREIAVSDIGERADLRSQTSIVARRLRSVMCVPMHRQASEGPVLAGLLYVDSPARPQRESERGLRILRAIAAHTTVALHAAETLAEAEERARRATELIHDLRSPAASLSMSGEELAMADDAPVWVQETGRLIEQQARRLLRVAEHHLSGARSAPAPVDVVELANDLGRTIGPLARSQGRSLLVETGSAGVVWAVDDDLQRILTNLMHNAIRHTPVGTAVRLRARLDGDKVVLSVCDEGPGLTEDKLALIFDSGVRGPGGGHGLGLSIARRLARLWGGELRAENTEAGGACFSLVLPVWSPG